MADFPTILTKQARTDDNLMRFEQLLKERQPRLDALTKATTTPPDAGPEPPPSSGFGFDAGEPEDDVPTFDLLGLGGGDASDVQGGRAPAAPQPSVPVDVGAPLGSAPGQENATAPADDLAKFNDLVGQRYPDLAKLGPEQAGVSDDAMSRATTGEPAPEQKDEEQPPPMTPDIPSLPLAGGPMIFPGKGVQPPDEVRRKMLAGEPLTAQDFVSGFTNAASQQQSTTPAALEGAIPGRGALGSTASDVGMLGNVNDELIDLGIGARRRAPINLATMGPEERAAAGYTGKALEDAGKAASEAPRPPASSLPPLPPTHGFDPAELPEYQPGGVEHEVETALRNAASADPEGVAHLSGEQMQQLTFAPKTTLANGKPAPGYMAPTGRPRSLDDIRAAIRAGLPYKDWYGDVAQYFEDTVGRANMPEAQTIFGITSAQTEVPSNVAQTFWIMRKARELLPTGISQEDFAKALNDEIIELRRQGSVPWATTFQGPKSEAVADAYFNGLRLGSAGKTPSYAGNVGSALASKYDPNSTNDAYMLRDVFGFKDKDGAGKADGTYRYVAAVQNYLSREMGITPMQAQAAAWIAVRQLKVDKRAKGLMKAVENGTMSLGEAVEKGAEKGIYDTFPGNLDEITTYSPAGARRDELLRVLDKNEAFRPEMRLEYPGQGRPGRVEHPVGAEQRARTLEVVEPQAPGVGVRGERVLEAMGLNQDGRTVPWITAPHEIAQAGDGVELRFPGGNIDTANYHAALVGDALGLDRVVIHHPIPTANNVIGAKVPGGGDAAALEEAARAIGGRVGRVGDQAVVYLPHGAGEDTLSDLFQRLRGAGYNPGDINPVTGASGVVERADYPRYLEALGRRFAASGDRSGLRDRAVDALRALRGGAARGADAASEGATTEGAQGPLAPASRRFYHGSGSAFDRPEPAKFDENGLFGPAYYLTDTADVAGSGDLLRPGYAEQRGQTRDALDATIARLEPYADDPTLGSSVQRDLERLRVQREELGPGGPNVRAVDVPESLNLLDADAALAPEAVDRINAAMRRADPYGLAGELVTSERLPVTGEQAWRWMMRRFGGGPEGSAEGRALVNRVLADAGYDGISYAGGQRMPMQDAAGKDIEHTAVAIFPDSMSKLRNAISGTPFGGYAPGLAAAAIPEDENTSDDDYARIALVAGQIGAHAHANRAATGVAREALDLMHRLRVAPRAGQAAGAVQAGLPGVAKAVRVGAAGSSAIDKVQTARYVAMLSDWAGRMADVATGGFESVARPAETILGGLATTIPTLGMDAGGRRMIAGGFRDIGAQLAAIPEAGRAAAEAFRTGERAFGSSRGQAPPRAFGSAVAGRAATLVTDAMGASDEFFQAMNTAGAAANRATREARGGKTAADILRHPTPDFLERVAKDAQAVTYSGDPGALPRWIAEGRRVPGAAGVAISFLVPFAKVAANIGKSGAAMTARSLVVPGLAEAGVKAMRGEGDAARVALGKTALAAGLGFYFANEAIAGRLTDSGPTDPDERAKLEAAGWQPNSWRTPDGRLVSIQNTGRFAIPIMAIANAWGAARTAARKSPDRAADPEHPTIREVGAMALDPETAADVIGKMARALEGVNYLRGVTDLIGARNLGDAAVRTGTQMAGSFVPAAAGHLERVLDPTERATDTLADRVKSKIPGLSQTVPAEPGLYGEERSRPRDDTLAQLLLPWRSSRPSNDPVAREVARLTDQGEQVSVKRLTAGDKYAGVKQAPETRRAIQGALGDAARVYILQTIGDPEYATKSDRGKAASLNAALGLAYKLADAGIGEAAERTPAGKALLAYNSIPHYKGIDPNQDTATIRRQNLTTAEAKALLSAYRRQYRSESEAMARFRRDNPAAARIAGRPEVPAALLKRRKDEIKRALGAEVPEADQPLIGAGDRVAS